MVDSGFNEKVHKRHAVICRFVVMENILSLICF